MAANELVNRRMLFMRHSPPPTIGVSDMSELLSAATEYIDILERKIKSLDPYSNMMPWDEPKYTDIVGAKGKWLAEKSVAELKGR